MLSAAPVLSVELLAAGDVGADEAAVVVDDADGRGRRRRGGGGGGLRAAAARAPGEGERAHGEGAEQGESGGRHGPTLRAL
ncbi:hypothetical protein [Micrococcus sp. KRD096]|uniref:hypothetical protein n=1 Tax=Micrococcus sp. KRD096 TaxID=2729721 RepID=UPI001F49813B|nr:hypothetical protein [Micrococcus sp. KRD096]